MVRGCATYCNLAPRHTERAQEGSSKGKRRSKTHLHQSPLNLPVRTRPLTEPPPANRIDLIHKNHTGLVIPRVPEHLPHHACGLADVLIDDGGGDDFEEVRLHGGGDGAREEGLACSGGPVEEDAFGGFDAYALEEFGVEEGEFDDLTATHAYS